MLTQSDLIVLGTPHKVQRTFQEFDELFRFGWFTYPTDNRLSTISSNSEKSKRLTGNVSTTQFDGKIELYFFSGLSQFR